MQTALERVAFLDPIPEHLAQDFEVVVKRLSGKQREQRIKPDLVATTAEAGQQDMRDKKEDLEASCGSRTTHDSGTARMTDEMIPTEKPNSKEQDMKDKLQTVPAYLAKLLKIQADLLAATVKHWQGHLRDKEGRAIPVDEELIKHAALVVLSTAPEKATPQLVIDEATVLRWGRTHKTMYYERKTALERTLAHLHEKGMPEHLAEAVTVFDKRSAEKPTEIGQAELELGMRLMDRLKQYRREEASQ